MEYFPLLYLPVQREHKWTRCDTGLHREPICYTETLRKMLFALLWCLELEKSYLGKNMYLYQSQ